MFCGNCGTENVDGVKFCKSCGKPLGSVEVNKTIKEDKKTDSQDNNKKIDINQLIEKIKLVPKKILISCICGVIALILIVCFVLNASSTINLNKYVTMEVSGYNGYGRAKVFVDWEAIEKKYGNKISINSKEKSEYIGLISLMTPMDVLENSVNVSLSTYNKLSNGDEIEYSWNIEDNLLQNLKCKVKYKDSTFKITELQEVGTFDAFEDLIVSFEGLAPNGSIVYDYIGTDLNTYDFSCDSISGLRNGDTVKVYINENNIENYAENLGKIPSKTEMEYTVDGLDEYVEAYSDLNEEFLTKLKSEAEDSIYAYIASSYDSNFSISDLFYAGYIMNNIIDGNGYVSIYNDLYIIYAGTVSNIKNDVPTTTVYFPVRFTNLLRSGEELSFSDNRGIMGYSSFVNSWYGTKGYTSPLNCYMEIVETNKDLYNIQSGDGFEKYSEYDFVSKLDDITDGYREVIHTDTKAIIESYIENDYYNKYLATDLTFVGEYLLNVKNNNTSVKDRNSYIVVFSATVSDSNGRFDDTTVYFPVKYSGLVKLSGDEYIFSSSEGIQGNSSLTNSYFYTTKGYIDGIDMYNSLITVNRENYTYDISEGLKQFGN